MRTTPLNGWRILDGALLSLEQMDELGYGAGRIAFGSI
jgi:hypothetical protein